jgi:hypothetical protein
MLRNARLLEDFERCAPDGRIGHLTDFFFDDRQWTIRYLVVDTGTWLDHREVLISPASAHAPDWKERIVPVDLSREQVRKSPCIDTEGPVSPEQEKALAQYYNWPMYWGAAGFSEGLALGAPALPPGDVVGDGRRAAVAALDAQHHIRSVDEVRGYRIEADDGAIGHVDDFLVDEETWALGYLVVDTRNWWPGKRVLISPEWIDEVGWNEAKVGVNLSREVIRRSPAFDPAHPIAADDITRLHEHYGYPRRSAEP